MEIIKRPSPNFSFSSYEKTVGVIHKTLGLMPGCLDWLTKPISQVSSQYLITKKGEIYQLVENKDMAWHAGYIYQPSERFKRVAVKKPWGTYVNPNKYTISIEFEAKINDTWTPEQIKAGRWLRDELNLPIWITHKDIASYKPYMEDWLEEFLKPEKVDSREEKKEQIIKLIKEL